MKASSENKSETRWKDALEAFFRGVPPESATWDERAAIVAALSSVSDGHGLNHTMLPTGGGQDISRVCGSQESGCIELAVRNSERARYLCKPKRLHFEHFPSRPSDSFFLLETSEIAPTDVYEGFDGDSEELLRLPDGSYLDRSYLDQGFIGYDEDGYEIPLPSEYQLVVRKLRGKFLFVARESIWNRTSSTYDGRHSDMTASEIRKAIEAAHSRA